MSFETSFIAIQAARDAAMLARHTQGMDAALILIGDFITIMGLVDNETDDATFQYAGTDSHENKRIIVRGPDLAPNIFGQEYKIGDRVSINGDNRWQIVNVIQSPDSSNGISNIIEIYIRDRD